MRRSILIVGSGWAGATLSDSLDEAKYSITVVSPETTTPYTPLLASAACGLYGFNVVETPIRHTKKRVKVIKARVEEIDFKTKSVKCRPAFPDSDVQEFNLGYDIIAISPGCTNHTFGTTGAQENALFLRNVEDAMRISSRVRDCFEKASIPGLTDTQQRALLHFIIVGAGPTGIEVASELSDLFAGGYSKLYPHLQGKVSVAVHDIADKILSGFDTKLQEYAMRSFSKRNVAIMTESHIEKVERDCLYTKEKGKINAGLIIWATGNKSVPLVDSLPVKKTPRNPRILTDKFLRVYGEDSQAIDGAYALGDCADIENGQLPTTAEVACQKASYLADLLNNGVTKEFEYRQKSVITYLGQNDGVISGKNDYSGAQAWIAWRSKNFLWTRTWRQKVLIIVDWVLDMLTGRTNAPR